MMKEFMEYVQGAFYDATAWNRDNTYSFLDAAADGLLRFPTPQGLRLSLSSLASPHLATSYELGSVGVVDGSISYLYSSVPLRASLTPQSEAVTLPSRLKSYRPLAHLPLLDPSASFKLLPDLPSLLYGRFYLPQSLLEGLVVKRLTPALQLQLKAVSSRTFRNGGTILGQAQYDIGRYAVEGLASTDGGLLGLRGIYNFGGDVEEAIKPNSVGALGDDRPMSNGGERERIYGRFSTGGEIYYGTLNKSGGVSLGARFATLPEHKGTPLTATLTLNPLMGTVSASYSVVAGPSCSLATRLDFNVYSYESDWAVGMELWRRGFGRRSVNEPVVVAGDSSTPPTERSFQAKLEWRLDEPEPSLENAPKIEVLGDAERADDEYTGVLKSRLDQNMKIGILWEGRVKSLLFSLGSSIDLRKRDQPFRSMGLEVQYSS